MGIQINGNTDTISSSDYTWAIVDKDGSVGTANQVLTSTGSALDWKSLSDLSGKTLVNYSQTDAASVNYTPSSASSVLVVLATAYYTYVDGAAESVVSLLRNSTVIGSATFSISWDGSGTLRLTSPIIAIDTPGSGTFNYNITPAGATSERIIILEFA